jgi:hypothetical protein
MRKDAYSNVSAVQAIVPAVKTAAGDGATIDRKGYEALLFVINTGAIAGDGDFSVVVQDSAAGSEWGAADASDILGAIPATLGASAAYRLSYIGSKRYVRLALTKEGGTSIALGAVAVLGLPHLAPVA